MYQPEGLGVFFAPEGVALIGVSTETGAESYNILEILRNNGYMGRLYPVNPKGGTLLGEKVYPSVLEVPGPIELAVISAPRTAVPDIVRQCIQKGVKGLVIITQGFADADAWGKAAQEEIVQICRAAGVRVIGPNTMGVANYFNAFSSAFIRFRTKPAAVGAGAQSGIFFSGSQFLTNGMGLVADLGNACDVSMAELVGYYGDHPQVKVISLHMEDVKDGREFLRVAQEVSRYKPVIVLKTGKSGEGARAVSSHSGSLAGEREVYEAALRQAGVIQAEDEEELNDLTKAFLTCPPLSGNRVGILTFAGGAGIIALDACERYGLKPARFSGSTLEAVRQISPEWLTASNPLDIWPAAMSLGYRKVMRMILPKLLEDPGVDALCIIALALTPPASAGEDPVSLLPILRDTVGQGASKPITLWFCGAYAPQYIEAVEELGLAGYPSITRAIRALATLYEYDCHTKKPVSMPEQGSRDKDRAAMALSGEPRFIGAEAFGVLDAYGLQVPPYRIAGSLEECLQAATGIGYPVVMKVVSPDVVHKSDIGGVVTDIKNPEELGEAYNRIRASLRDNSPGASITGFMVQKQIDGGKEVILGVKRDPRFGPILLFGAGGIFAEMVRDVSFRVAPVSRLEAAAMVEETQVAKVLKGTRGQQALDLQAVVDSITALSQLAMDFPQIASLDINPLRVLPRGALALDVRVEWRP